MRTAGRRFTYSAALCQVALDRGARLAERYGYKADVPAWRTAATHMRQAILAEAWDAKTRTLTAHLGGGGVDASLLALPLRRVLRADDPRMVATTAAIVERLGAGRACCSAIAASSHRTACRNLKAPFFSVASGSLITSHYKVG